MTHLRVALLGSPRVERDDAVVSFDTRKATALVAYLAMTGRPQGRDTLAGLLWPDHPQVQARGALRRTLSVLNSATGGDRLVADRSSVSLRAGTGFSFDVAEFRDLTTRRDHDHAADELCPACIDDLEVAAALHRDEFMAGFSLRDSPDFDEWQSYQAQDLRRELADVLKRLVRARVRAGDLDAALGSARRWLALDPLHEPAHAMLMRLYAWSGQRSAALQQYRDCVRILQRELGVAPLSETSALDEAVRSGRLGRRRPAEGQRGAQPAGAQPAAGASAPRVTPPDVSALPFVGRTHELALVDAARAAVGTGGRVVVVSGETGIGKSRLVAELASGPTGPVVMTRCHEGEAGLAFGVITEVVRGSLHVGTNTFAELPPAWQAEVGRLLPELTSTTGFPQAPPLDSPGAQGRFFAALVAAVAASFHRTRPGTPVVAVEDLQWVDESSAEVLAYLLRRLREIPILVALTWRPESMPSSSPLRGALAEADRDGVATTVELGRLDRAAVAALAAAALPAAPPSDEAVGQLWAETGGLPLFVAEYLESFRRTGRVPEGEEWQLPGGVRDLLRVRLAGLSETAEQVLAAGAVLGGDMAPALLQATSGRGDEEVVAALEEALRRGVIVETHRNGGTYEFTHDAARRLIYETTSLARRRLLHSRAADAVAGQRDPVAATVANHLRRAGRDAESAQWSWRAAQRARGLYAHGEALDHLASAAALGYPGHEVHQATGDVLTALGRYREALVAYEQAAAACPPEEQLSLAILEHRLAEVHHRLGAWDVAGSHLAAALNLLGGGEDQALLARVLADLALIAHRRGDPAAATTTANRALETATSADDDAALAQAHDVLGVLAAERGDVASAERHLRASLDHAAKLTDPGHRVAALNNLSLLKAEVGEPAEAVALAREALHLGLEHGDRHRAAALYTNLADLLHATGEQAEALDHLTSAARLFAGVDDDELRHPEIWKLSRW